MDVYDFKKLADECRKRDGYRRPAAFGIGIAYHAIADLVHPNRCDETAPVLAVRYLAVNRDENDSTAAILARILGHDAGTETYGLDASRLDEMLAPFAVFVDDGREHVNLDALQALRALCGRPPTPLQGPRRAVVTFVDDLDAPPADAADVYLRLQLLSHRKIRPHGCSLEGAFGLLANCAWTERGPVLAEQAEAWRQRCLAEGDELPVRMVDKFPRMTDFVIPSGVRIADADRVRLGAHLAEGTTVMHEGFVNFNAGTLGRSMIEGRISAGVVVGDGSDIGGGASIMGTLSGGGKETIAIGEGCLLGANAGLGISLGDRCTVEAGLYLTAGTKVTLLAEGDEARILPARELSGRSGLLFRRNSTTGVVEAHPRTAGSGFGGLNPELHKND